MCDKNFIQTYDGICKKICIIISDMIWKKSFNNICDNICNTIFTINFDLKNLKKF